MEMAASREKEVFQKGFKRICQAFNCFKGKSENVREKIEKEISKHSFHLNIVQIGPPSVKRALWGIFFAKNHPGKGLDPLKVKTMVGQEGQI